MSRAFRSLSLNISSPMACQRPDCCQISAGWSTGMEISCTPIRFLTSSMMATMLAMISWARGRKTEVPGPGLACEDMGFKDFLKVRELSPAIPSVFRIDNDHRPVAALGEAAGLVDPHLPVLASLSHARTEDLHVLLGVALGRASLPAGADEHVDLVLTHVASPGLPRSPRPSSR